MCPTLPALKMTLIAIQANSYLGSTCRLLLSWRCQNREKVITSPPIGGGRGIVMPMSVCLCVCLFVCVFVCPCFRKISKCNISAISQPIIMKLGIHITYGYTVTDKYFQNFRSKVKVVGRRKVKNVIWPYLGNEWS